MQRKIVNCSCTKCDDVIYWGNSIIKCHAKGIITITPIEVEFDGIPAWCPKVYKKNKSLFK